MKCYRSIIVAASIAAWSLALPHVAEGEDADVAAMMAEIQQLTTEKDANNNQIKIDLQAFNEASRQEADKQAEAQQATAALADLQRQGQALIAQYGGSGHTVNCDTKSGPIAACKSAIATINAQIATNVAKVKAASMATTTRNEKGKTIAGKKRRNEEIDRRIGLLRQRIALTRANAGDTCRAQCSDLGNEAAAQCLQCCWDKARCGQLPTVEQVQRPTFSMIPQGGAPVVVPAETRRRNAEQAIQEYKQSGAQRPGPQSFRMRNVPPPKF